MKVSVIVPCYNAQDYIESCVKCLLKQTYKNIEIILVDDLSKDNTKKIIKNLEKKYDNIRGVISKTNNGAGGAKSEGLKMATGKYIMFLDCDDYIDDDYIEQMVEEVKKDKTLDIIISGFKKVNTKGDILYKRTYKNFSKSLYQSFSSWAKLYRLEWLRKNNLYLPYGPVFDDVMFQAALILCKPKYTLASTIGYNYLYNEKSVSHTALCAFKKGSMELEQEYLLSLKRLVKDNNDEDILTYYAYRTMIWHLLKSGSNVGKEAMLNEYNKAFNFLNQEFPDFKRNKLISIFHANNERLIIRLVLFSTRLLYKFKLSKLFFSIYGRMNLKKLWPNM